MTRSYASPVVKPTSVLVTLSLAAYDRMHVADVDLRLASFGLVSFGILFIVGFTDVRLIAHARTVVLADRK